MEFCGLIDSALVDESVQDATARSVCDPEGAEGRRTFFWEQLYHLQLSMNEPKEEASTVA